MALYNLILNKQVRKKDLPKVPTKTRRKLIDTIGDLRTNPRPADSVKLTNREEYKLRSGSYRILYVVNDRQQLVEVRKVGHRGQVYKN